MEDRRESNQADRIMELIRAEKEAAETRFETARFDARLFERMRSATAARPTLCVFLLRKPGPAAALAALVLAVAAFLLFRKPSPSPFQQTIRAISAVLEDAGDGRKMKGEDSTAQRMATAEYTEFGWSFKRILYACQRESLSDIDLAAALSLVFLKEARPHAPGWDEAKSSFPRGESFSLRTEEDFQIFFTGFLKKFEEV